MPDGVQDECIACAQRRGRQVGGKSYPPHQAGFPFQEAAMRISKRFFHSCMPAVLLLVPLATYANEPDSFRPGVYLGGSWGAYRIDESNLDDNDDLLKAFIGGQFTSWFGLEGQWTDFNRLDSGNSRFEADGGGLAAVFSLPLGGT